MDFYWRLKNIPELGMVLPPCRRKLWSEAVSRSLTGRQIALFLGMYLAVSLGVISAGDLLGYRSGLMHEGIFLVGLMLGWFATDYWLTQPRARRWLREHAGELGRYTPS
ncbi:MAG: hypothetical protein ABI268_06235 [Rhodanobacter sp.]